MRTSVSFWTSTSSTGAYLLAGRPSPRLEVLGWDPQARRVHFAEHDGACTTLSVMAVHGEAAGATRPLPALPHANAETAIARLRDRLTPLAAAPTAGWDLTTRVLQRRGLHLEPSATPVRKFVLLVEASRISGFDRGRTTVVAYLRPATQMVAVWTVPGEDLSVVTFAFCGAPVAVGVERHAALLAAPLVH